MRRGQRTTVLAVACALAAASCSSSDDTRAASAAPASVSATSGLPPDIAPRTTPPVARASPGCVHPARVPVGVSDHTIESRGVTRAYELTVPASYDGTKPYAIVFGLHALTVNHKVVGPMVGFANAERYRFIGVAPSGRLNGTTPFWMAAPTADNYDVRFVSDLLDHLERSLCIDTARVFSTGMSNGAQLSSLLACRLSERITAIAPVAGAEYLEPCAGEPVPIMAFHGSEDPILPYAGGGLSATSIAATNYWMGDVPADMPEPLGIDESMRRWARHNGCDPEPAEERVAPHVRRRTWRDCAAATVLYVVDGAGHTWPGQPFPQFEAQFGPGTTEIDATALLYRFFFANHPE
jgi:polyhydroxybutyrate depolymerase